MPKQNEPDTDRYYDGGAGLLSSRRSKPLIREPEDRDPQTELERDLEEKEGLDETRDVQQRRTRSLP
jgi:hypothetical protein